MLPRPGRAVAPVAAARRAVTAGPAGTGEVDMDGWWIASDRDAGRAGASSS
jgi:hypothetical protein